MLKEKYRFKLTPPEAQEIINELSLMYTNFGNTTNVNYQLPLTVLQEPFKRLGVSMMVRTTPHVRLTLKKSEALAFHSLFMIGIIRANFLTAAINHEIHKTL